jgi:hypothetical protein
MDLHQCQCPRCRAGADHPERLWHRRLNLLLTRLDEQQRRWLVALESQKVGRGGDRLLSLITGLHVETIRRGRRELEGSLQDCPPGRIRRPGAGRPAVKKNGPTSPKPCGSWLTSRRRAGRGAGRNGSATVSIT